MRNFGVVIPDLLYRSGRYKAWELKAVADRYEIAMVVDLRDRPPLLTASTYARLGLKFIHYPVCEKWTTLDLDRQRNIRNCMRVLLYQVGRNLNRAYRTCEAFGVDELLLFECQKAFLGGNLFKAAGRVMLTEISRFPQADGLLALETYYGDSISVVDWGSIHTLVIGGETYGLPRSLEAAQKAHIPTVGQTSGLTVEAALAIALYEWRRNATGIV